MPRCMLVDPGTRQVRHPYWGFLFVLLALVAFSPALHGGILIDDPDLFAANPNMESWAGLLRTWSSTTNPDYYPVTYTAFWVQRHLWGLDLLPYHLTSVLFHALDAFLVLLILRRLGAPLAWFAAAVFAVHPVQVESVAWMSEFKNVFSGTFFLLSIYSFARYLEGEQAKWYASSLACSVAAILAKGSMVMLSPVLVLLLWWKKGRIPRKDWTRLAPFLLVSFAGGLLTVYVHGVLSGGMAPGWSLQPGQRVELAGRAFWFYLEKAIWPAEVCFNYPSWALEAAFPVDLLPFGLVLLAPILLAVLRRRWSRHALLAYGFFFIMLFPFLGFFDVYYFRMGQVADRFQYLALIGPTSILAAGLGWLVEGRPLLRRGLFPALAVALGLMGYLSWRQSFAYRDLRSLWEDTLRKNPASWMAHDGMGTYFTAKGDLERAEGSFREALRCNPRYLRARGHLGVILVGQERRHEGWEQWEEVLRIDPGNPPVNGYMGEFLVQEGKLEESIPYLRRSLERFPDSYGTRLRLAAVLSDLGRDGEAASELERVLELYRTPDALRTMGWVQYRMGNYPGAVRYLLAALSLDPLRPDVALELSLSFAAAERWEEAAATARKASRLARRMKREELAAKIQEALEAYEEKRLPRQTNPMNVTESWRLQPKP